jgi:hypothetical protein
MKFNMADTFNVIIKDKQNNTTVLRGESTNITRQVEVKDSHKAISFHTGSLSGTLNDVKINREFVGLVTKPYPLDVVLSGYNLPRGNKLPKRKRIREKWIKKYFIEKTIYNATLDFWS